MKTFLWSASGSFVGCVLGQIAWQVYVWWRCLP